MFLKVEKLQAKFSKLRVLWGYMPKKNDLTASDIALREQLGAAIRKASSERSIKPQAMADAAGVSLAHQYRIEGGETTPDALYLFKVCRLLGISIDSLFAEATSSPTPTRSRSRASASPAAPHTNHGVIQHQNNIGSNNLQIGQLGVPPRARRR